MARRMEIELTSSRPDGSFTWRAAGAREPRGVIDATMVPSQAAVGLVLRVEADFGLEGISIVSVLPPRDKPNDTARIELAPRPAKEAGTVTASVIERRGRPERRDRDRPERSERRAPDRERRPRPAGERPSGERPSGARRGPEQSSPRPTPPRRERPAREPAAAAERPQRGRPPRLVPGTAHRDELFATLPPEQRPIAEQLAVGGLPAVRRALADERAAARAAGRPEVGGDELIAVAEQLVSPVKEAVWLDRAEAVTAHLETVSLRDLRATVASAAPRDDAGRELLRTLRSALDERLTKLRTTWEHDLTHALDEGRILQALRLSARPPEPTARLSATLVGPLAQAAGAALSESTSQERWLALLEAAAASPVRRLIRPAALPSEDPEGKARQAATLAAGRIPALATLLGLAMPPPPRPGPRPASPAPARRPRPTASPTPARRPAASGGSEQASPSEGRIEAIAPHAETGETVTSGGQPVAPSTPPDERAGVPEEQPGDPVPDSPESDQSPADVAPLDTTPAPPETQPDAATTAPAETAATPGQPTVEAHDAPDDASSPDDASAPADPNAHADASTTGEADDAPANEGAEGDGDRENLVPASDPR